MEKKPSYSICFIFFVLFCIITTLNEYGLIFGYVLGNPSSMPFFIIYVSVGIVSFIAWLVVEYRGRPINTSSYSHVDNPDSTGYIDYERQKDYD